MAKSNKKQTEEYQPQHRWTALFLKMDEPGEAHVVEWCAQCGKLKLKPWETKARNTDKPRYFVPNADYPRDLYSSHNGWAVREPPECRPVPVYAR